MSEAQLEEVKKEIRSLLISYQKGTSLSEFIKEYRKMIGRHLPFKDFKFKDEASFLSSLKDVVKMFPSPVRGDYHLFGIADESVAHIQKMVIKQKTTKHRTVYRMPKAPSNASSYAPPKAQQKAYSIPPRFAKKGLPAGVDQLVVNMLSYYPDGLRLNKFLDAFCRYYHRQFLFKEWGYSTLEECLEIIPGINARNSHNEIIVYLSNYFPVDQTSKKTPLLPIPNSKEARDANISPPARNRSPLLGQTKSSVLTTDKDYFDRNYDKNVNAESLIDAQSHKGNSQNASENFLLQSKINKTPPGLKPNLFQGQPKADTLDDFTLIDYREEPKTDTRVDKNYSDFSNFSNASTFQTENSFTTFDNSLNTVKSLDSLMTKAEEDFPTISENIKNNIKKVIENFPHGIFAVHFKDSYEKIIKSNFDLHSLGFNNLIDFVDAVPDILTRRPLAGSKKDWIIYPSNSMENESGNVIESGKCSVLFLECVILNTRRILQAYAIEGIRLGEFMRIYSVNCKEPLHIKDLGFNNLENFLLSIAARVPLRITMDGDEKIVHLDSFEEIIKPPVSPLEKPLDVASPTDQFKTLELPSNFDYTKYVPVYTSSIANPGLLYIQLEGEEWSEALKLLYDRIELFYNSEHGEAYKMKPEDIKINIACAALWPVDKHWYRAKITSIVSLNVVQVFYIDYGTTDEVPLDMLRYIKQEYMELPVQALKSRLAYLKPPIIPGQTATSWDKRTRRRMLQMCQDRPLMAKIENIKNGILALILCDTSGENDIYINDVLANENLAELCNEADELLSLSPVNPVNAISYNPGQVIPSPTDIQSLALQYLINLAQSAGQNFSMNAQPNVSPYGYVQSQPIIPPAPSYFPPTLQQSLNTGLINSSLNTAESLISPIQPPVYPAQVKTPAVPIPKSTTNVESLFLDHSSPENSSPDDGDIFDDEDDDFFEQLCQQTRSCRMTERKKRFVKRIKTTDGYVFHVLLFEGGPYVSSGDISVLIWHNKSPSQLFHRLQIQEMDLPSKIVRETDHEEFIRQLERFKVKGIETYPDSKSSVLIYPLEKVNEILNLYGHPSAALRAKVNSESTAFNPSATHWLEFSDDETPEEIEDIRSVTDDDKLNRLCLFDLKTMKEGIQCKRMHLLKSQRGQPLDSDQEDEINKLNQLYTKVRERIVEIEQICKMYAGQKT